MGGIIRESRQKVNTNGRPKQKKTARQLNGVGECCLA